MSGCCCTCGGFDLSCNPSVDPSIYCGGCVTGGCAPTVCGPIAGTPGASIGLLPLTNPSCTYGLPRVIGDCSNCFENVPPPCEVTSPSVAGNSCQTPHPCANRSGGGGSNGSGAGTALGNIGGSPVKLPTGGSCLLSAFLPSLFGKPNVSSTGTAVKTQASALPSTSMFLILALVVGGLLIYLSWK